MKKSKLFGSRLIENVKVPKTPRVLMTEGTESIQSLDFDEGDILDANSIKRQFEQFQPNTNPGNNNSGVDISNVTISQIIPNLINNHTVYNTNVVENQPYSIVFSDGTFYALQNGWYYTKFKEAELLADNTKVKNTVFVCTEDNKIYRLDEFRRLIEISQSNIDPNLQANVDKNKLDIAHINALISAFKPIVQFDKIVTSPDFYAPGNSVSQDKKELIIPGEDEVHWSVDYQKFYLYNISRKTYYQDWNDDHRRNYYNIEEDEPNTENLYYDRSNGKYYTLENINLLAGENPGYNLYPLKLENLKKLDSKADAFETGTISKVEGIAAPIWKEKNMYRVSKASPYIPTTRFSFNGQQHTYIANPGTWINGMLVLDDDFVLFFGKQAYFYGWDPLNEEIIYASRADQYYRVDGYNFHGQDGVLIEQKYNDVENRMEYTVGTSHLKNGSFAVWRVWKTKSQPNGKFGPTIQTIGSSFIKSISYTGDKLKLNAPTTWISDGEFMYIMGHKPGSPVYDSQHNNDVTLTLCKTTITVDSLLTPGEQTVQENEITVLTDIEFGKKSFQSALIHNGYLWIAQFKEWRFADGNWDTHHVYAIDMSNGQIVSTIDTGLPFINNTLPTGYETGRLYNGEIEGMDIYNGCIYLAIHFAHPDGRGNFQLKKIEFKDGPHTEQEVACEVPLIEHLSSEEQCEISPNVMHVWKVVNNLNLTLKPVSKQDVMYEYMFEFQSPENQPTNLTLPSTIKWYNGKKIDVVKNKRYQASILNNVIIMGDCDV